MTKRSTDVRVAWFNCQAGVAGDMTMAALVDAGADPDVVAQTIAGLGVDGYALLFERVQRCGVGATWANVVVHDPGPHDPGPHDHGPDDHARGEHVAHRPAREVLQLLDVQRHSGVLAVSRAKGGVDIFFRQGSVDLAIAEGVAEEFLLGRFIVDNELMTQQDFHAYEYEGQDYDCGSKLGYFEAVAAFARDHAEIGEDARAIMKQFSVA